MGGHDRLTHRPLGPGERHLELRMVMQEPDQLTPENPEAPSTATLIEPSIMRVSMQERRVGMSLPRAPSLDRLTADACHPGTPRRPLPHRPRRASDSERPGASFREVFHDETLRAAGGPTFRPLQWNISESAEGTLRGFHAEPWNKLVHVAAGRVFAAIADLRPDSATAGKLWTGTLDRANALFVSAGLGNAFQAVSEVAVTRTSSTVTGRPMPTTRPSRGTIPTSRCRGRSPTNASRFRTRTGRTRALQEHWAR